MRRPERRLSIILAGVALLVFASTAAQAGSIEDPEVLDVRRDTVTDPGGIPLCVAQQCPPTFQTFPGDLEQAWMGPETEETLQVNLQINGSAASGSSSTFLWTWSLHWSLDGSDAVASVTMLANGDLQCGGLAASCLVNSSGLQTSRVLELLVPRAALANAAAGTVLTSLWAEAHGSPRASPGASGGAADRAPDSGYGSDYTLTWRPTTPTPTSANGAGTASSSAAATPDKSSPGLAPAALVAGLGLAVAVRRRKQTGRRP